MNFQHFPPPLLRPACELFASLFFSIVLVGGGFFPHLCWRDICYYISADLESKVRHLWWPNFLQPNSTLCLMSDLLSKRVRRDAELLVTQSFQRPSYRKNALIYKGYVKQGNDLIRASFFLPEALKECEGWRRAVCMCGTNNYLPNNSNSWW